MACLQAASSVRHSSDGALCPAPPCLLDLPTLGWLPTSDLGDRRIYDRRSGSSCKRLLPRQEFEAK